MTKELLPQALLLFGRSNAKKEIFNSDLALLLTI